MNYETGSISGPEKIELLEHDGGPPRRFRNLVIAIVVIAVVIGLFWLVFGRNKDEADAAPVTQLASVTVVVPGRQTIDRVLSATGTLAARRDLPVGVAGEGGEITRVLVQAGDWVKSGQVLATVDRSVQTQTASALSAQISVAQSDQSIAQSELDRAQQLVGRGFISKADLQRKQATLDAAAARVKVAKATLGEARARNGRLDIRAPAAGLVLVRNAEPGQIVSAGSGVLFRIAMDGKMEMQAALSEADLQGLSVGARASVVPVGSAKSYPGQVWQISPVIDPNTRQGIARVALGYNPGLRPGGFAAAKIVSGASSVPQLPDSAIQSDQKGSFVYVLGAGNKVERRDITIGQVSDAGVSIASGLQGNEKIVLSAGGFLSPGQQIKPIIKKAG